MNKYNNILALLTCFNDLYHFYTCWDLISDCVPIKTLTELSISPTHIQSQMSSYTNLLRLFLYCGLGGVILGTTISGISTRDKRCCPYKTVSSGRKTKFNSNERLTALWFDCVSKVINGIFKGIFQQWINHDIQRGHLFDI